MRELLDSPWQTLGIPFAFTPIGQLHQSPPSKDVTVTSLTQLEHRDSPSFVTFATFLTRAFFSTGRRYLEYRTSDLWNYFCANWQLKKKVHERRPRSKPPATHSNMSGENVLVSTAAPVVVSGLCIAGTSIACGDASVPSISNLLGEVHEISTHFHRTCKQSHSDGLWVGEMFTMDYHDCTMGETLLQLSDTSPFFYLFVNLWVSVNAWLPPVVAGESVDLREVPHSIRKLIGYEQSILTWEEYDGIEDMLNYFRVVCVRMDTPLRDVWTCISRSEGWNPVYNVGYFSTVGASEEVDEDCTVHEFCTFAQEQQEPLFPCLFWPDTNDDTGSSQSDTSSRSNTSSQSDESFGTATTVEMYDMHYMDHMDYMDYMDEVLPT